MYKMKDLSMFVMHVYIMCRCGCGVLALSMSCCRHVEIYSCVSVTV